MFLPPFLRKPQAENVQLTQRDRQKKKTAPKKPWGRKERFWVVGILAGTLLVGIGGWLNNSKFDLSLNFGSSDFANFFQNFVPSKTVTFEKDKTGAVPTGVPTVLPEAQTVKIIRVIDGDTVVLSTGQTLRYIGMDTPERGKCFFEEAKVANEKLVLGKDVKLEKDISETDRYKRLLRYVWVVGEVGKILVNEELVRQGYATVLTFPPDVAYQDRFLAAQKEAREEKRGIWSDGVCNSTKAR